MTKEDVKKLVEELNKYKKPVHELKDLERVFKKVCTNAYRAVDLYDSNKSMLYRRDDLTRWAGEAFEKGEKWFYCEPVDKNEPCGALRLCEPKYVYQLKRDLTEEEFNELFGEKD